MRTLVIDSATEACSVALFEHGKMLAGELRMLGRGHAEQLVPMIAALPGRGKAARIAVDVGPGSFTGIRVGLAAAKALALVWDAELVGYGALAMVAAMARDEARPGAIDVAMSGGHGEWFVQRFDDDGAPLAPATSLSPADTAAISTAPVIAGSQAEALAALRSDVRAIQLWPDARAFTLLHSASLHAAPRPAYGRGPDARIPAALAA